MTPTSTEPTVPTVICADGVVRPAWAANGPAREYFDTEWGRPVREESALLELFSLFVIAGGLTWSTVLARRDGLRAAFASFDAEVLSAYEDGDVERLLGDPRIVRNRHKVEAVLAAARATCALRPSGGLVGHVWGGSTEGGDPAPLRLDVIPRRSPRSERLAATLTDAGFRRVGPVTTQSVLVAAGVLPVERERVAPGSLRACR